jgi:hypothetical protein
MNVGLEGLVWQVVQGLLQHSKDQTIADVSPNDCLPETRNFLKENEDEKEKGREEKKKQ